jgi:tetratricopeptide (TPR) repeat protein
MSALEQALHKLQLQGQSPNGPLSWDAARTPLRASASGGSSWLWRWLALALLALLLVAGGLVFWGVMPLPHTNASQSSHSGGVQGLGVQPSAPLSLPAAQGERGQLSPTSPAVPSSVSLVPSASLPTSLPGESDAVTAKKFTFPAWHKTADRLWSWGVWDAASQAWLHALKSEDPGLTLLLIAEQQTLAQATRQYHAWAMHLPVVVLPQKVGEKKRWLVLAAPVAQELDKARQLLFLANGRAVSGAPWAQWQDVLAPIDLLDVGAPKPAQQAGALAAPATLPAPSLSTANKGSVKPLSVPPVVPLVPIEPVLAAAPVRAAKASRSAVSDAPAQSMEPVWGDDAPQLSRTNADRLSKTGPVSPAAKAIEVDFLSIEKSLARGEHQGAWDSVRKLEKYIGVNWRTQYLSGVALMGLTQWDQAITALAKAQELNPGHTMAALYHSLALQERGEHVKAIQVLQKALDTQPQSPELWLNQAHSYQALGQRTEAVNAYQRFLDLSVHRPDLAAQRAWVQSRLPKDKG